MLNTSFDTIPRFVEERGFTFIEVLIVIAIFSVGILAVAVMQVKAINTNTSARLAGEATALAANQLEALMALGDGHDDLDPAKNPQHEIVDGAYKIKWIVTELDINGDGTNDSKTILVTVSCSNPKAKDVQIQYIIPEV